MKYKNIRKLFKTHNDARDYLAENPHLLVSDSELVQVEFRVVKGAVDILLKKADTFYLVEVKDRGSLYSARQQLCRYGRMFERFGPLFQDKKLKYIIVKVQKYLGTDIYLYDDLDDVLNRKNNYDEIHRKRCEDTKNLPEIKKKMITARDSPEAKEKWEKNMNSPEARAKWKKNMTEGIAKRKKKLEEQKHL